MVSPDRTPSSRKERIRASPRSRSSNITFGPSTHEYPTSEEMPWTAGARSMISGTPSASAASVGRKAGLGSQPSAVPRQGATGLGRPVRPEQGAASEPGVGLVEDLHDVVASLRGRHEPADLDLGHARLELGLDAEGDVVRQALDLTELVELHGGVRKGTAGHLVFPCQTFEARANGIAHPLRMTLRHPGCHSPDDPFSSGRRHQGPRDFSPHDWGLPVGAQTQARSPSGQTRTVRGRSRDHQWRARGGGRNRP